MSNTIQIKRGSGTPPNNGLAPYELGYDITGKQLYIGEPNGEETVAQPIGVPATPTTTLLKSVDSKKDSQNLQIYCEGLVPGKTYTLCLYTLQKSRGNASRYWRHPKNERDSETEIGTFTGYANMAGKIIDGAGGITDTHPDIPSWMTRNGILQTEWQFVAEGTTQLYVINLNEWIIDLLKPIPELGGWGLIGLSNKKQDRTSRPFQFRLLDDAGQVGNTNNTLLLSRVSKPSTDDSVSIGFFSIR